jgi:hypothetical protein
VRAVAEGTIRSGDDDHAQAAKRARPRALSRRAHGISLKVFNAARKLLDGTTREGMRGFPENVSVATAALSLDDIGPDKTRLEIWGADRQRSCSRATRRGGSAPGLT